MFRRGPREQQGPRLRPGWHFQPRATKNVAVAVHPGAVASQRSRPHSFFLGADTSRLRSTILCPVNAAGWAHAGAWLRAKADDSSRHKEYGLELTTGFIKSAIRDRRIHFVALNSVVIGCLIPTKLCTSNLLEYPPSIARDETRGK